MEMFLRGFCSLFSIYLNEVFGYHIYRMYSREELEDCWISEINVDDSSIPYIHDFYVYKNHYIDVRGILPVSK